MKKTKIERNIVSLPSLRTIHVFSIKNVSDTKKTMQAFYKDFLKNDPDFFYCIEPELLIRCGTAAEKQITKVLKETEHRFTVYDWPKGDETWMFDDRMTDHLEILLPIWHKIAVANLTLTHEEYTKIRERVFHLFVNMHFQDFFEEAYIHTMYAKSRLENGLEGRR